MCKNRDKIAISLVPDLSRSSPFARNEDRSSKTDVKLRVYLSWSNPFARNEVDASKTEENRDFSCAGLVPEQPFRTKWGSIGKNWGKIAILLVLEQPFRMKWRAIVKNWGKNASVLVLEKPFRTKWWSIVRNWGKMRFFSAGLVLEQPLRTKWWSMVKNWVGMFNFTPKKYEWVNEVQWFLACGVCEQSWLVFLAYLIGMLNYTLKKIWKD